MLASQLAGSRVLEKDEAKPIDPSRNGHRDQFLRRLTSLAVVLILVVGLISATAKPAEASPLSGTAVTGVTCWNNTGSYTLYGWIFGAAGEKVWWRVWHQDLLSGIWYSDVNWKSQTIGSMGYPFMIMEYRNYVGPYNAKQFPVPIQAALEVWRNGQSLFYFGPPCLA